MRPLVKVILVLGVVLPLFASCTLIQRGSPISRGEMRLVSLSLPEVVEKDVPYDVVVTFQAEGDPKIRRACFRWLTGSATISAPAMHCYAYEVQGDQAIGSVCSRWLAEGPYAEVSPPLCTNVEDVAYGTPGTFMVTLYTRNVRAYYNHLECYAEYVRDGEVRQTNRVRTRILVGDLQ